MTIEEISFYDAEAFLQANAKASEMMSPIKEGVYFAVKEDGKIIGTVGYREREHTYKIDGHYVLKEYRKKGIGGYLFNYVLQLLLLKTPKDIVAYATNDSIGFYKRNGFTIQKAYKKSYLVVKRAKDENIL